MAPASAPADKAPAPAPSEEVARGVKALEAGDLPGAKAAFEAGARARPTDADPRYYLGLVAEKQGDKQGAERSYREALKHAPGHEASSTNLSAMLVDYDRADEAAQVARAALQKRPASPTLRLNLAVALAAKGDQAAATREFDDLIRASATDPRVRFTYGHWLGAWKSKEPAVRELVAARTHAGDDVGLLAGVGHELRMLGAFSECVATYDRALQKRDVAELRTERALCKLGVKDDAGALADLEAAVAREPNYAPAHFYLGGRHATANRWKDAAKDYETYLRLEPTGPLAKQAQERAKLARERAAGSAAPRR